MIESKEIFFGMLVLRYLICLALHKVYILWLLCTIRFVLESELAKSYS